MRLEKYIAESSLSKIWNYTKKYDTGTITAFRGNYTKVENLARNKSLLAKLFSRGYSITKVLGTYIEDYNTPSAKEVGENVFFVVDIKDKGKLRKDLLELGKEFEQDSILFIPKNGNNGELIGTNSSMYPGYGKSVKLKDPIFGEKGEFFTKVNNRPFILKEDIDEFGYITTYHGLWGMSMASKKDWKSWIDDDWMNSKLS